MFKTIVENVSAEVIEKKSKFIANIFHVESVDEAEEILKELGKKYHDARHNCYAFKIAKDNISRASDDGEPSGTAGMPILNILNGNDLSNVLVVVTRYFGGILLGTGGLVRAYSEATAKAIEKGHLANQDIGLEIKFNIEYKDLEEYKYQLKKRNIEITDILYDEKIEITAEGSVEEVQKIMNEKISDRIAINKVDSVKEKYVYIR